ncbi:MAG: hypothetical protein JKY84_14505 [Emcibacteraceae bacterium]|nr:hypothetical protein [Emcibacteraceae bacterium]
MNIKTLQEFWSLVVDVWDNGVYGVAVGQILAAFLLFFSFMLLRHVFAKIVIGRLKSFVGKTKNTIDDEIIDAIEGPLGFFLLFLAYFLPLNCSHPPAIWPSVLKI